MSPSESKGDLRSELHIQRLDDAPERMIRCETQIEGLEKNKTSKEDVANTFVDCHCYCCCYAHCPSLDLAVMATQGN